MQRLSTCLLCVIGTLVALATLATASRADESTFKDACSECHRSAARIARGLEGATPEERARLLSSFLKSHHAPDPAVRAAVVEYLISLPRE